MRRRKSKIFDIYITTGAGNTVGGGSDVWVNNWLKLIPKHLDIKPILLIDNYRFQGFEEDSIPIEHIFYNERPDESKRLLQECRHIHFLHNHYTKRPHLWKYRFKFKSIAVHAYAREIVDSYKELGFSRDSVPFLWNVEWQDELIRECETKYWVGSQKGLVNDIFNDCVTIPNYYEFIWNKDYFHSNVVGFAARAETRKAIHFLENVRSNAFTSSNGVKIWEKNTKMKFNNTKIIEYNPNLTDEYYTSSLFGIFHGAYVKEPFGYSILQAVDAGKLPIISKGWCPEFNYPYRASSKEEFENMVKLIQNTNKETRENIFNSAKSFLKKFDNKDHWVERMKTIYNE